MGASRLRSAAGVVALAGALLLTTAPSASADYIRDKQWVIGTIDFQKVWKESRGMGVTVAVVDSGVDDSHPDLTGQVLPGKDFSGGGDGTRDDTEGHGTGMASLIAGHGHGPGNSSGVMGLAPESKILPVQYWDDYKQSDERLADAIRYAVDEEADVINLSLGDADASPGSDTARAVAYAQHHDVVVVAATGNDGLPVQYPAKLPGVVAVGAVDADLQLWERSNHGAGVVLTAPGVDTVSADPTEESGYATGAGTSDAAAYVSATAALVRSKYPDLTAGQVINRLIKSATFADHKVSKSPDDEYGYGIIRPWRALAADIPKGPTTGPLPQAPPDTESQGSDSEKGNNGADNVSPPGTEDNSSTALPLIIGAIVALVLVSGIVFAVVRSRRDRDGGGPGGGATGHQQAMQYPVAPGGQQPPSYGQQQPYQGP